MTTGIPFNLSVNSKTSPTAITVINVKRSKPLFAAFTTTAYARVKTSIETANNTFRYHTQIPDTHGAPDKHRVAEKSVHCVTKVPIISQGSVVTHIDGVVGRQLHYKFPHRVPHEEF